MVPSLADLLGAGLSATIDRVTSEPAGITTRPSADLIASLIVAVKVSPALLVRELSAVPEAASIVVPTNSVAARGAGAGSGAGAGVAAAGAGAGAGAGDGRDAGR